jgi:hypothetical protein
LFTGISFAGFVSILNLTFGVPRRVVAVTLNFYETFKNSEKCEPDRFGFRVGTGAAWCGPGAGDQSNGPVEAATGTDAGEF